jgi:hypothetical protein
VGDERGSNRVFIGETPTEISLLFLSLLLKCGT